MVVLYVVLLFEPQKHPSLLVDFVPVAKAQVHRTVLDVPLFLELRSGIGSRTSLLGSVWVDVHHIQNFIGIALNTQVSRLLQGLRMLALRYFYFVSLPQIDDGVLVSQLPVFNVFFLVDAYLTEEFVFEVFVSDPFEIELSFQGEVKPTFAGEEVRRDVHYRVVPPEGQSHTIDTEVLRNVHFLALLQLEHEQLLGELYLL